MKEMRGLKLSNLIELPVIPIAVICLIIFMCYSSIVSFLAVYAQEINLVERHGLIGKLVEPYPKPIRKKEERHYLNDIASLLLVMNVQLVRQYGQWLHRYHS